MSLAACKQATGESGSEISRNVTLVNVTQVTADTVERLESSIGRVETFSAPEVSAEVDGRIIEVLVDVGDQVELDQTLARIDREPFELRLGGARASRSRLEVERAQWQRDLDRMENVAEEGFVSESDIENARSELSSIEAQLDSIRYEEQQAERDLRRTEIVSPVPGEVDTRAISEGDYVSVGDRVFTVSPLTAYRVSLTFPQSLRDVLERGQLVRLYASDNPEDGALGQITRIRPSVDGGSRSLVAVVDFEDPGGWRPGMTVSGEVVVERRDDALRIPRVALVQRPSGRVVYVLNGDHVEQRLIETGHQTAEWIEVVSGLRLGDTIVTDGAQFLTDGAPIRLREDA